MCIVGDSFNSSLVAIVSVDPDVMKDWAASEGIKVLFLTQWYHHLSETLKAISQFVATFYWWLQYEHLGQLCNDPRVRKAVLAEMDDVGKEAQVKTKPALII